jgi:hypothetical protein
MKMVPSDLKRCPREKRPGELRISPARSRHVRSGFSLPMTTVRLRAAVTGSLFPTCFFLASPNALQWRSRSNVGPAHRWGAFLPRRINAAPLWYRKAHLPKRPTAPSLPALGTPTADHRFGPAVLGRLAIPQTSWNHLNSPPDWPFKSIRFDSLKSHIHGQRRCSSAAVARRHGHGRGSTRYFGGGNAPGSMPLTTTATAGR